MIFDDENDSNYRRALPSGASKAWSMANTTEKCSLMLGWPSLLSILLSQRMMACFELLQRSVARNARPRHTTLSFDFLLLRRSTSRTIE